LHHHGTDANYSNSYGIFKVKVVCKEKHDFNISGQFRSCQNCGKGDFLILSRFEAKEFGEPSLLRTPFFLFWNQ